MYSSRYHYPYRYRKNRIQSKYSPAARKQEWPTYTQQKGRILQTSPRFMYNPINNLPNSKTYDRMYETLQKVKYPALIPQPLPNQVLPFAITNDFVLSTLFDGDSPILDNVKLQILMDDYLLNNLPELIQYHPNWTYQIFNFYLINRYSSYAFNDWQFHIDWKSNLIGGQSYQMVLKTVDNPMSFDYATPRITVQPRSVNELRAYRISQTTGGNFTQTYNDLATNDPNTADNGLYPLIDTSAGTDSLYHSEFEWVSSQYPTNDLNIRFVASIICFPA